MNTTASLIIASVIGLVSGMSHGVVSHYQDLPLLLSDQVLESFNPNSYE